MQTSNLRRLIAVVLLAAASGVSADSMECNGNLVSSGDSMQTVLQNCGEPTSRNGDQWIYQPPNQDVPPNVVTFSNGLVDTITEGNFPGFKSTPFENAP
jgi:hypothetical protein